MTDADAHVEPPETQQYIHHWGKEGGGSRHAHAASVRMTFMAFFNVCVSDPTPFPPGGLWDVLIKTAEADGS